MKVVLTEWALTSYMDLRFKEHLFGDEEFEKILRPDVLRLLTYDGDRDPKFAQSSFWGPAQYKGGKLVPNGFKMKWHNFGNGNVNLRLGVVLLGHTAYVCRAWVKKTATDFVQGAELYAFAGLIERGDVDRLAVWHETTGRS